MADPTAIPILADDKGRSVSYLRLSVTDRCNLRCLYCDGQMRHRLSHLDVLRYEELLDLMGLALRLGIGKVRLTGGEPFARRDFMEFLEHAQLAALGFREPGDALARMAELRQSARYQQLPSSNRQRLDAIGPRLIEAAGSTRHPDQTLVRGLSFLEIIARRGAYLALLQQYPMALKRVADMICASSWAATSLPWSS